MNGNGRVKIQLLETLNGRSSLLGSWLPRSRVCGPLKICAAISESPTQGYGRVAKQGGSCCGLSSSCCGSGESTRDISRRLGYSDEELNAVPEGASLGLGCGNARQPLPEAGAGPSASGTGTTSASRRRRRSAGGLAVLSFVFLWILLPTWVYVDGTERGVRRARLFAFLTVISSLDRPRRLPHLAARGREGARLPRLRAGGERRGLLPALRAGPLGGLLRDLPLPAEARLGLLPLLPHRDEGPVAGHGGGAGGRLGPRLFEPGARAVRST